MKYDEWMLSCQLSLASLGVAKSSTSFDWGKGGWQVTLCDPIWHVIFHSGVVISITNCYIRFTLLYLCRHRYKLYYNKY